MNFSSSSDVLEVGFWPRPVLQLRCFIGSPAKVNEIESFFDSIFMPYRCLLFSSSRVSLKKILEVKGFLRNSRIWLMPYSSHCVINAVGGVSSPNFSYLSKADAVVCYHQFGHLKKVETNAYVIEDSVDSFCLNASTLFCHESSEYEILSLPKILGNTFGAIVVCRSEESYLKLRSKRDEQDLLNPLLVNLLRALKGRFSSALYLWEGASIYSTKTPQFVLNDIQRALVQYSKILQRRNENISYIEQVLGKRISRDRLPTAIPLPLTIFKDNFVKANSHLLRTIYTQDNINDSTSLEKRLLLPLHHEVDKNGFKKLIQKILK